MCPVCFATAALIAGGVISTGGLTVLAVKSFGAGKTAPAFPNQSKTEEDRDGQQHDPS
jgi:hypothetical protein